MQMIKLLLMTHTHGDAIEAVGITPKIYVGVAQCVWLIYSVRVVVGKYACDCELQHADGKHVDGFRNSRFRHALLRLPLVPGVVPASRV